MLLWHTERNGRGGLTLLANNGWLTHRETREWNRYQRTRREFKRHRRTRSMAGK